MKGAADWPTLPLTEAFWFQEGPGVRNWQFTTSGIKLLNVANIEKGGMLNLEKTDRHLNETEVAKKYSHFLVDAGDLVIASSGISFDDDGLLRTRGAFVRAEQLPLCLNTSTIRFKAIDGVSDLRFLRLWLNGREFRSQITKLVTGTAQQNFGPSHLKATKITLPPLAEQRRIAEVLDRAEALRAKRRAALAQLDSLIQSLFLDLFGDPATNPKGWPVRRLGELIMDGPQNGLYKPSTDYGSGTPILRIDAFYDGAVTDIRPLKRVRITDAERITFRLTTDDVVINRVNSLEYLGKCALIPDLPEEVVFESNMMRMRFDSEATHPRFVIQFLQTGFVKSQIHMRAKHAVNQASINQQDVSGFRMNLPPLQLQREFARRVGAVEKLKTAQRASLAELDGLFATLQHRAFRGEL